MSILNKIKGLFDKPYKKDDAPASPADIAAYEASISAMKESNERTIASVNLDDYEIVKGVSLRAGDIIVHDYMLIRINSCGCGFGVGNEFGNYYWIKGHGCTEGPFCSNPYDFWTSQGCPVIRKKAAQIEEKTP